MADTATAVSLEDGHAWGLQLDPVVQRIASRFARSEARSRVRAYLVGLLGPVQRKNAWQLAEQVGGDSPYAVQHLLGRSDWDLDEVREELRTYAVEALGDDQAVLILDETGFFKKGKHSAGVARQYTGPAGRIENAQVGLFLSCASRHGTAFFDRALYLPREWTDESDRCQKAGIPEGTVFATKSALAKEMLSRAFEASVPAASVTGDKVFGSDGDLRRWLETQGRPYVLAVRENQYVCRRFQQFKVRDLLAALAQDHDRLGVQGSEKIDLGVAVHQP